MTANGVGLRFPPGTFTPAPGRGRPLHMLRVHARTEAMLTLRNSEQILLTLLIPLALLIGLSLLTVFSVPEPRVDSVTPRVLALAVMSSAFTGQAIALGFDRRYGVVVIQLVVLCVVAALLGWSPSGAGFVWAVLLVILGTISFGALGVLLGGALKAEVVLALANIVWFILLLAGGIIVPASSMPGAMGDIVGLLPSGALADGMRIALVDGNFPGWQPFTVLAAWAIGAGLLATRTTRLD